METQGVNEKAPVEEGSSKFGERPELARLVHSQSVARNNLQLLCVIFIVSIFWNSGFIVIIVAVIKHACSFSPYMTAVNASVVGSGPILEKKNIKHCCGKRLLKRLKNTKSCSNPDTDESNRKSSKN